MAYWQPVYYTVPSTGTVDISDLKSGISQSIANGYSTGSVPNNLRGCAPYYNVSTSGTVSISSFRGKSIQIDLVYVGGGGEDPL